MPWVWFAHGCFNLLFFGLLCFIVGAKGWEKVSWLTVVALILNPLAAIQGFLTFGQRYWGEWNGGLDPDDDPESTKVRFEDHRAAGD